MKYAWAQEWQNRKVNPNKIGRRIDALKAESGGTLTPDRIVEDARNPSSPLHRLFEWHDTEAARKYRLQQARQLMCSIVVIRGPEHPVCRAYVNITGKSGREYMGMDDALKSSDVRREVLARALAEAKSWKARYEAIKELSGIIRAIDEADDSIAA